MAADDVAAEMSLRDRELLDAIEEAHAWLERVEEYRTPTGYIGLDHRLGQNVEGCTYCHAAAVLHGLAEPVEP